MNPVARFLVAFTVAGLMIGCKPDLKLDYEQMVLLDAESLAEVGIGEAYEELLPKLSELVSQPATIEELENSDTPSYAVRSQGQEYLIYGPDLPDSEGQSWGRATHAFFSIVNTQLETSSDKFYAINAANDLGGMFLTEEECEAARRSLPRREDWPYIPTGEAPWFGQFH
ncbi:MAG: hypothetical protein SF066_01380 [Thermoanaerobaculia bacterium]|nr:hypothetical protein [Thermoanaerobaculia bacterium]